MLRGGLIFPIFLIVILGALDLKRALSLSLTPSHKWERGQMRMCSLPLTRCGRDTRVAVHC
jgi:hypothetical protein